MSIAASLKSLLPEPTNGDGRGRSSEDGLENSGPSSAIIKKLKDQSVRIPGYGERETWVPRSSEDYGDGGAYPEVHLPQFPLEMGKNVQRALIGRDAGALVPTMTDAQGRTRFDAVVLQGHAAGAVVHSRPSALVGRRYSDEDLERPSSEEVNDTVEKTKRAIQAKLDSVLIATNASRPNPEIGRSEPSQLVRYTSAAAGGAHASGASQRLVKIVEKKADPLEPPKFRVQKAATLKDEEAPVPVLHDAPKKLTKEEADAWVVPVSFSNWNSHGFTIGLDKRELAASAMAGQQTVSSGFATMAAALDTAQQTAREQVAYRARLEQQRQLQQRELEDQQAREVARQARLKRAGIMAEAEATETEEERQARLARDAVRHDMRRDQEDEHRRERMGKTAKQTASSAVPSEMMSSTRAGDRDISERIALGQTVPRQQEVLYDSRLFNQTAGLDHGYVNDEEYNLYDKPLLSTGREEALFKGINQRQGEVYQEEFNMDRIKPSEKGKSSRGSGPVEFERDEDAAHAQRMEEIERQKSMVQARLQQQEREAQDGDRKREPSYPSPPRRQAPRDADSPPRGARRYPSPPHQRRDSPPHGRPSYPSPPRRDRYPSPPRRRVDDASERRGPAQDDPMDSMLSFMSDARSGGRKREREDEFGRNAGRGPTLGHMHAVGGSSGTVEDYRDSKRAKVAFVSTRGEEEAPHRIREDDRRLDVQREESRDYPPRGGKDSFGRDRPSSSHDDDRRHEDYPRGRDHRGSPPRGARQSSGSDTRSDSRYDDRRSDNRRR